MVLIGTAIVEHVGVKRLGADDYVFPRTENEIYDHSSRFDSVPNGVRGFAAVNILVVPKKRDNDAPIRELSALDTARIFSAFCHEVLNASP